MLPLVGGLTIGGTMMLDSDIAGASSALELDRLCTQEYRKDVTSAVQKSTFDISDAAVRLRIVEAIAVNYMKPTTTSTADSYIVADAELDARKLKAAVDACVKIVRGV